MISFIQTAGGDEAIQTKIRSCLEALQAIQFASAPRFEGDVQTTLASAKEILSQLEKIDLRDIHHDV